MTTDAPGDARGVADHPLSIILAATFQSAHLTAEIDWRWRRVGATEYEIPGGGRAQIATSSEQLRGLPRGTRAYYAHDFGNLPWEARRCIYHLLDRGDLIPATPPKNV